MKAISATAVTTPVEKTCNDKLSGHDHVHASNCGHPSFMHGDHVCFLHDDHYHYMHDGHVHACTGPNTATVLKFDPSKSKQTKKK